MKKNCFVFILLLCIGIHFIHAQGIRFDRTDSVKVVVNSDTLNNAWAGGIDIPLFSEIDLNGDGIHDLFMFDKANNRISTFINDGSTGVKAWHYAPQYVSKFPPVVSWALLYDYNCDGKADFFTLAPSTSGMSVYRNDFDSALGGLRFTLVQSELMEELSFPVGFHTPLFTSSVTMPALGDVDGDGDMDILGFNSSPDGRVVYHKNYSVENSHGCDSLEFKRDTETWGHFAVAQLAGGNAHVNCFSCRHANNSDIDVLENYDQSAAAARDDSYFSIFMIDIDGDGDKELLIGDSGADNSLLVVNGGTPVIANMVSQQVLFPAVNPAMFCSFHYHAYIDVDNDSIKDLLVESGELENLHNIWYYKNTGTNSVPQFAFQSTSFLVDQMLDVGEASCPVLFDADADGLKDLITGNYGVFQCGAGTYKHGLHLYKNIGSLMSPVFQLIDSDFAGINAVNSITGPVFPAFGDLDSDGDEEMIIGSENGKMIYYENTAGPGNPASFPVPTSNYMGIDVGNTSTPQLIDLNRDGLLDIISGAENGHINYYENIGSGTTPAFSSVPTNNTLGGIIIHSPASSFGYTVPYFFYNHSHLTLFVSCGGGEVYQYDSIENNLNGNFHLADSIIKGAEGIREGFNLSVSGGDLNNDGLTDLLLGIYSGGVSLYMQKNPNVGVQNFYERKNSILILPNPADEKCVVELFNEQAGEQKQLIVLNYLGQQLFSQTFSIEKIVINTNQLPPGIYMVQINSPGKLIVRKLVVKH